MGDPPPATEVEDQDHIRPLLSIQAVGAAAWKWVEVQDKVIYSCTLQSLAGCVGAAWLQQGVEKLRLKPDPALCGYCKCSHILG